MTDRITISLDPIALRPIRRALADRISVLEGFIEEAPRRMAMARTIGGKTPSQRLYEMREELTHLRSTYDQIEENIT